MRHACPQRQPSSFHRPRLLRPSVFSSAPSPLTFTSPSRPSTLRSSTPSPLRPPSPPSAYSHPHRLFHAPHPLPHPHHHPHCLTLILAFTHTRTLVAPAGCSERRRSQSPRRCTHILACTHAPAHPRTHAPTHPRTIHASPCTLAPRMLQPCTLAPRTLRPASSSSYSDQIKRTLLYAHASHMHLQV